MLDRKNIFWSLSSTLAQGLFVSVLFILIAQYSGAAILGHFSWAFQAWMLTVLIASFGGHQSAIILTSNSTYNASDIWHIGLRISLRNGVIWAFLFACLASYLIYIESPKGALITILCLAIPAAAMSRFLSGHLIGLQRISYFGPWVLSKTAATLLLCYLIETTAPSITSLCIVIVGIEWVGLVFLIKVTYPCTPDVKSNTIYTHYLKTSRDLGFSSIFAESTTRIDLLIIGMMVSAENTGIYGLISTLGRIPLMVSQSYLRLLVPGLVKNQPPSGSKQALCLLKDSILHILLFITLGTLLLLVVTPFVISAIPLRQETVILFAIVYFIFSLQASLGSLGSVFISWGKARVQLYRQAALLVTLVLLIYLGTKEYGISGAVAALSISYVIYVLSLPLLIRYTFKIPSITPMLLIFSCAMIPITLMLFILPRLF